MSEPLTEDWLRDNGFKWHQLERQPNKHWLLWLGPAIESRTTSFEDLGIEVTPTWYLNRNDEKVGDDTWFCWLRSDAAGRYHRFLHVRHLSTAEELVALIEALTGQGWNPAHNHYGSMHTPKRSEAILRDMQRMDIQMMQNPYGRWYSVEKDDTRGRALPEHMEHHAKTVVDGKVVAALSKGDGR